MCLVFVRIAALKGFLQISKKDMFYEEIWIKQGLFYISFCSLRILYNSKSILMATSLGTNDVIVMRVHCISLTLKAPIIIIVVCFVFCWLL